MSSRSLGLAASNVMNVPRPLVELIKAGYSPSKSLIPDMSTSPDFSTTDNRLSFLITFSIASSNTIFVGSPIQVLNTRYGKSGLQKRTSNTMKLITAEHTILLYVCNINVTLILVMYDARKHRVTFSTFSM